MAGWDSLWNSSSCLENNKQVIGKRSVGFQPILDCFWNSFWRYLWTGLWGRVSARWSSVLLMAFSSAAFFSLYTIALFRMDVSAMAPLFSFRVIFAFFLGVVFLNESISLISLSLVAIIVIFSPLATYNPTLRLKALFTFPVLLAVAGMFFLALLGYYTTVSSRTNGYATTVLWADLVTCFVLLPTIALADRNELKINVKKLKLMALIGFTSFIYTAAAAEAYRRNLALSSVIISLPLSMILAVTLSKRLPQLKEDHSKHVYKLRFLGAGIMIAAGLVLSFVS